MNFKNLKLLDGTKLIDGQILNCDTLPGSGLVEIIGFKLVTLGSSQYYGGRYGVTHLVLDNIDEVADPQDYPDWPMIEVQKSLAKRINSGNLLAVVTEHTKTFTVHQRREFITHASQVLEIIT